ncbi:hypothetical protein Tco_0781012 [Tanacetum coccineum]
MSVIEKFSSIDLQLFAIFFDQLLGDFLGLVIRTVKLNFMIVETIELDGGACNAGENVTESGSEELWSLEEKYHIIARDSSRLGFNAISSLQLGMFCPTSVGLRNGMRNLSAGVSEYRKILYSSSSRLGLKIRQKKKAFVFY